MPAAARRTRQRPIRPKTAGVTREAAEAHNLPEGPSNVNLLAPDDDNAPVYDPDSSTAAGWYAGFQDPASENTVPDISGLGDVGSVIDAQVPVETPPETPAHETASDVPKTPRQRSMARSHTKSEKTDPDSAPLIDPEKLQRDKLKTGPPDANEWLDFFSRIILKVGMNAYIDMAFKDVNEDLVTPEDLAKIKVSREERDAIARPLAEYATKNPYTRKHGRQVVALTDSIESLMTLGIWMRRVNRIAKKYKPAKPKNTIRGTASTVQYREATSDEHIGQASPNGVQGTGRGFVSGDFGPIINPGSG